MNVLLLFLFSILRWQYWTADLFVLGNKWKLNRVSNSLEISFVFTIPWKSHSPRIATQNDQIWEDLSGRCLFLSQQWNTQNWWRPLCNGAHCYFLQCPISGLRKMYNGGKRWKGAGWKKYFRRTKQAILWVSSFFVHRTLSERTIYQIPSKATTKNNFDILYLFESFNIVGNFYLQVCVTKLELLMCFSRLKHRGCRLWKQLLSQLYPHQSINGIFLLESGLFY